MSGGHAPPVRHAHLRIRRHARTRSSAGERTAERCAGRRHSLSKVVLRQTIAGSKECNRIAISFWQKRYYDRNVRDAVEFTVKLRYLHRNPVKRGLVKEPGNWKWSSFRHYALREIGIVEIESEWTARDRKTKTEGTLRRLFLSPG